MKQDVIVIFGCACCLVQSALSLVLLVAHWIKHPTCILYLKIQLCLAIVSQMCMFLYATKNVMNSIFKNKNKQLTRIRYLFTRRLIYLAERLRILLVGPTNSDHSRDNVAFESVAHRLHGDNQFPTVLQY